MRQISAGIPVLLLLRCTSMAVFTLRRRALFQRLSTFQWSFPMERKLTFSSQSTACGQEEDRESGWFCLTFLLGRGILRKMQNGFAGNRGSVTVRGQNYSGSPTCARRSANRRADTAANSNRPRCRSNCRRGLEPCPASAALCRRPFLPGLPP